jgi:hypothetical protein
MGKRNVVRQIRTLLTSHDFNLALDTTAFDTAEDAIEAVGDFYCDVAIVDFAQLQDHLREMLRLRGIVLGLNIDGEWTISVDTESQARSGTFGWKDGVYENTVSRPVWSNVPLKDVVTQSQIAYRRKRNASGAVDRFVRKTAPRDVLPDLPTHPITITEIPTLRESRSADIFADYYAKHLKYADIKCAFSTGEDGLTLQFRDTVTVLDPTSGISSKTMLVSGITDNAINVELELVAWDASIYTYESAVSLLNPQIELVEEDIDIGPEDGPDFAFTFPPPVGSVQVTVDQDNRATVTWAFPPNRLNYLDALVSYREKTDDESILFASGGSTDTSSLVVQLPVLDAPKTYQFRVTSRNRFGLMGIPVDAEAAAN